MECEERFSGEKDLAAPGERAPRRARTAAGQRTDQRALATAGEATNEGSEGAATTGEDCCTLAFAFFCAIDGAGGHRVAAPVCMYALQADGELSAAFEAAERLRVNHGAVGAGALRDDGLAVDHYVIGNGRCK